MIKTPYKQNMEQIGSITSYVHVHEKFRCIYAFMMEHIECSISELFKFIYV